MCLNQQTIIILSYILGPYVCAYKKKCNYPKHLVNIKFGNTALVHNPWAEPFVGPNLMGLSIHKTAARYQEKSRNLYRII